MPRTRDISLTLALCLSLTVHAWVIHWVVAEYVAEWATLLLPPLAKSAAIAVDAPPPPPPVRVVDRMDQLGDDQTSGNALASSAGDLPQQSRQASQEQASLSLDPEGTGGAEPTRPQPAAPPVFAGAPQPEEASPKFEVPGSSTPPPPPQPVAVAPTPGDATDQNETKAQDTPADDRERADQPREQDPPTDNTAIAAATPPQPNVNVAQDQPEPREPQDAQPQAAQRPSPPAQAALPGDPAPQADSESDAFSTEESVEFRRGKTVARLGRKHKLISPRLEMVAYADLLTLRPPVRIVLRLYIDSTGTVVKADIIKPSGSVNIDVPTKQAAYKWWFEPRKDSQGQPVGDVFEFVVGFS